jgi:hypothetical protein
MSLAPNRFVFTFLASRLTVLGSVQHWLIEDILSMLKAKGSWRHARHLVEAPAEVALVGESSREGDVSERMLCACEQLLRTQ